MGVTIKSTNNIPKLTKVLKKLEKREIKVGIFGEDNYEYGKDADLVTIARVHEFGAHIKPVQAQWLTIPLIKEAKGKRPKDFGDELFFYMDDSKKFGFLARKKFKNEIQNVFLCVKSVEIPERSYLRTGFDQNVKKIGDKIEELIDDVIHFRINPEVFLDMIGAEFASMIQEHMKKIKEPPNSPITINVKGSSNPLHDTGRLIGAIRHEVE